MEAQNALSLFLRIAVTGFLWNVSSVVGFPLSAALFNSVGYTGVMASILGLYILASVQGLVRLWGFQEKIEMKCKLSLPQLFSPSHILSLFKASFRPRPGRTQVYILMMMLVMVAYMLPEDSETMVQFMFTKRHFQWEYSMFSYYNTIQRLMNLLGVAVIFPLFQYFNGDDNIINIATGLSKMAGQFVRAFARTEAVFFSSTVVGTLRLAYNAPVRSQISKFVEPEELGKVSISF